MARWPLRAVPLPLLQRRVAPQWSLSPLTVVDISPLRTMLSADRCSSVAVNAATAYCSLDMLLLMWPCSSFVDDSIKSSFSASSLIIDLSVVVGAWPVQVLRSRARLPNDKSRREGSR